MTVFEELIGEFKDNHLLETADAAAKPGKKDPDEANPKELEAAGFGSLTRPADEREFYRKRAMDEVSSLKIVEHIFSAIEREYLKKVPTSYDDIEAKKALHRFLQLPTDVSPEQFAEGEYALLQETETWSSSLAERDSEVAIANLRLFCENSVPALSSQGLIALARFYRNSVFRAPVRAKFDFVMTRLFAHDVVGKRRQLLFRPQVMPGHIRNLYANWASVTLVDSETQQKEIWGAVAGFQGYIEEAESAASIDVLISGNFFQQLNEFKESLNDIFYVAEVTAAAIECNVRVGNRFVELIRQEHKNTPLEKIEEKYGYTYDQLLSEAACKTLGLINVLKTADESADEEEESAGVSAILRPETPKTAAANGGSKGRFAANNWIVLIAILSCILSASVYFWAENLDTSDQSPSTAKVVEIPSPELRTYLKEAKASRSMLYAVTTANWDSLGDDQKRDVLEKTRELARTVDLKKVQLINHQGRSVGFANPDRVVLQTP